MWSTGIILRKKIRSGNLISERETAGERVWRKDGLPGSGAAREMRAEA